MRMRKVSGGVECPYLVGDVYVTTRSDNPSDIWAGTSWERIRGRFLLAEDDSHAAGSEGGSANHTHTTGGCTLTVDQIPGHTHSVGAHAHTVPAHGHGFTQPTVNGGAVTNGITGGSHTHKYAGWRQVASSTSGNKVMAGDYIASDGELTGSIASSTHTHNLPGHTHSVSGGKVSDKAAFNTNNSTAFDSGSRGGFLAFSRRHGRVVEHAAVPGGLRLEAHGLGRRWHDAA